MERLDWREVDLVHGHIEVTAAKAKTARRRLVTIGPNLREWLLPLNKSAGSVTPNNFRRRLAGVRETAGMASWPENCLRHLLGSYHVAHFGSAAKKALKMGHVNAAMLFANYQELVSRLKRPASATAARAWTSQRHLDLTANCVEHPSTRLRSRQRWYDILCGCYSLSVSKAPAPGSVPSGINGGGKLGWFSEVTFCYSSLSCDAPAKAREKWRALPPDWRGDCSHFCAWVTCRRLGRLVQSRPSRLKLSA